MGEIEDLDLLRHCACGCLACSREGQHGPDAQGSFDRYARTRRAFDPAQRLGLHRDLPAKVAAWLDDRRRSGTLPSLVGVGLRVEPMPGFEEANQVLLESLWPVLDAGVGVTLRTRLKVPREILDLLSRYRNQVHVTIPIPTLENDQLSTWEPGASSATQRLHTVQQLRGARIPTTIAISPLVPYVNDDPEHILPLLGAIADSGVRRIGAAFMRLTLLVRKRLSDGAPISTRLLFGAYRERGPDGGVDQQLPESSRRRDVYRLIAREGRSRGLRFNLCRCADPYFGSAPCLLAPEDAPAAGGTTPDPRLRSGISSRSCKQPTQVGFGSLLGK